MKILKLTNKLNLPAPIYHAAQFDEYDDGGADISVTRLIQPPRMVALKQKYGDKLELDAADQIWLVMGKALHKVLEWGREIDNNDAHEYEVRKAKEMRGWVLSGAADFIDHERKVIVDFKFTKSLPFFKARRGEKPEWEAQLNILRWLFDLPDYDMQIVTIIKDYEEHRAAIDSEYPNHPVATVDVRKWDFDEVERYVEERIIMHQEAQQALDLGDPIPECTPEDRWARPKQYRLKAPGMKRSKRTTEDLAQLIEWALTNPKRAKYKYLTPDGKFYRGYGIYEADPDPYYRCRKHCLVAKFCDQYQKRLKEEQEYGIKLNSIRRLEIDIEGLIKEMESDNAGTEGADGK